MNTKRRSSAVAARAGVKVSAAQVKARAGARIPSVLMDRSCAAASATAMNTFELSVSEVVEALGLNTGQF